ncbi:leucyl aminopeptidase [Shewanella algae]|uniref:leucyl aminopeptidase n=1 Tax=Shewanella algae TaxID=38313 RepID=UPI003AAD514A
MNKNKRLAVKLLTLSCLVGAGTTQAEQYEFATQVAPANTLVMFQHQDGTLYSAAGLQADTRKQLQRAIAAANFKGQEGELLELLAPIGTQAERLLLLGLGDAELTPGETALLGGKLSNHLEAVKQPKVAVWAADIPNSQGFIAELTQGISLASYRYRDFTAKPRTEKQYHFAVAEPKVAETNHLKSAAIADGVALARDLTNKPAAELYPESFADAAKELKRLGVKVKVLEPKDLAKLNMGALLAVGKGSERGPRLVVAHWQGSDDAPVALVGKGITFDSGGYNIKATGTSIARMKSDMAGAATVLGTVKAMAASKAPVNLVGIMPLAENMVSGRAMIPGDVIKTAQGLTVEVLNTDAEGRLVLADGLWYAREKYQPQVIVDVATLTGSKVRALGVEYAGLFSDSEPLVQQLTYAGQQVGEKLWRLPLDPAYGEELHSSIADLTNTGREGSAGASSAAMFLKRFAGDQPWAHLDIAGNALVRSDTQLAPAGATGYGVRLLSHWLEQHKFSKNQ